MPADKDSWNIAAGVLGTILVIGVCGNILCMYVFHKGRRSSTSPCALYWKCLAAADLYVILGPCLELFLTALRVIDLRRVNNLLCKFGAVNVFFPVEVSTWITVSVTVDRALCVCYPLKFRSNDVAKWRYIKVIAIVVLFFVSNLYLFTTIKIETPSQTSTKNESVGRDQPLEQNKSARGSEPPDATRAPPPGNKTSGNNGPTDEGPGGYRQTGRCGPGYGPYVVHDLIHFGVFVFALPFLINGACNVLILRNMYQNAAKLKSLKMSKVQVKTRYTKANQVTYRVLAVSIMHFVTFAPLGGYLLYMELTNTRSDNTQLLLNSVYYGNSAINVFLYCVTGTDFRRDLKDLVPHSSLRRGTTATSTPVGLKHM